MNYSDEPEHARQVRQYYDLNTGRFLRWCKDEGTRNIHAALWPPEVGSLAAAMNQPGATSACFTSESTGSPRPISNARLLSRGLPAGTPFHRRTGARG